jgi:hypothetical protein
MSAYDCYVAFLTASQSNGGVSMKLRISINSLAALIGVWFIIAPWVVNFSDDTGALWTSVIIGAVQVISSLLGFVGSGWNALQNWISLLTGVWFIIFPFIYTVDNGGLWASVVLGAVTVIINLWILSFKEARLLKTR